MAELPTEPSTAELLKRIVRLENQVGRFGQHQADLDCLKAEVSELGAAFKAEVTNVTGEFKHICQYIADIHDQLWPVIRKVFPGSLETQQQFAAIMKTGAKSRPERDEGDPRRSS